MKSFFYWLMVIFSVVIALVVCGKNDGENNKAKQTGDKRFAFPAKNERPPFFYNNSSFINDETSAMIALKASSKTSDVEIGMAILKDLPKGYSEENIYGRCPIGC